MSFSRSSRRLVTLKPGTGDDIVPGLAESWTLSSDGLTYTFKIRSGVKFSDGTDLDAAAVKFNFDRWLNLPQSYVDAGLTFYPDTVIGRGATANVTATAAPDATTFSRDAEGAELRLPDPADADALRHLEPEGPGGRQGQRPGLQEQPVCQRRTAGGHGHRPVRLQGVGHRRPRHADQEPELLECIGRRPLPRWDHLQADRRSDRHAERAAVGRRRHLADPRAGGRSDRQGRHQAAVLRPWQRVQHGRRWR